MLNQSAQVTGSLSVSLAVRPARLAILIPPVPGIGWMPMVESAIAAQSQFWGGQANLVLPSSADYADNEVFWALMDRHDPDTFVVAAPSYEDFEAIDKKKYDGWYDGQVQAVLEQIPENGIEGARSTVDDWKPDFAFEPKVPEDQDLLFRRLGTFNEVTSGFGWVSGSRGPAWPWMDASKLTELPAKVLNPIIGPQLGVARRLWAAMQHGRLSPGFRRALEERGVEIEDVAIRTKRDWSRWLTSYSRRSGLPWTVGETGIQWYSRSPFSQKSVVVVGDSPWDFALFYALRRWTSSAWWINSTLAKDPIYMWNLASEIQRDDRGAEEAVLFTTAGTNLALRDQVISDYLDAPQASRPATSAPWSEAMPDSVNRYFEWGSEGRSEAVPLLGDQTPQLSTPVPKRVSSVDPLQMHWIVEARVDEWAAIRNGALSPHLLTSQSHEYTRTSSEGLSYYCPGAFMLGGGTLESAALRPKLAPLSVIEQVKTLLEQKGKDCQLSDKGIWTKESVDLFGGIQAAADSLRDPATRLLLNEFAVRDSAGKRPYLSLRDASKLLKDPLKMTPTEIGTLVEGLTTKGVLNRGLHLKCEKCRHATWYGLDDVGETFRCARCRHRQSIQPGLYLGRNEPAWVYDLAAVVRQFLEHHGDLPLLTAWVLFGDRPEILDVAFETEIFRPGHKRPDSEMDIVASIGHELWIGESTTTGNLDDLNRIDTLKKSADDLSAYGVIFSTSKPTFKQKVLDRIDLVFSAPWPKVIVKTGVRSEPSPDPTT